MNDITAAAKKIRLAIFDVDGVLTSGFMTLDAEGRHNKMFYCHDGIGLKMLQKSGVTVAIITTCSSKAIAHRMTMLGITRLYQGCQDKFSRYQQLKNELNLDDEQVAMTGDDLPDAKIIRCCGLGIAVANAVPLVKQQANYTTSLAGGHGAVREVSELIMRAQGTLEQIQNDYL
ncbi:MAG: HAD hydrolase family protein [Gammaproteobacteria bacterium]|nr:HAD hydrolase family protein [Gammaproteobacteria bacterium]